MLKLNKSQLLIGQKVVLEKQSVESRSQWSRKDDEPEVYGFYDDNLSRPVDWYRKNDKIADIDIGTTLEVIQKLDRKGNVPKKYFDKDNLVWVTDGEKNYSTDFKFFKRMVGLGDNPNLGDDIYEFVICYKGQPIKTKKFKDIGKVKASLLDLMAYHDKVKAVAQQYSDRVPEVIEAGAPYWIGVQWAGSPTRNAFKDITINKWKDKKLGDPVDFNALAYYDEMMTFVSITGRFGSAVRELYKNHKDGGQYNYILCYVHEEYRTSRSGWVDYEYLKESEIIKDILKNTKLTGSKKKCSKYGKTAICLENGIDLRNIMDQLEKDSYYIMDISGKEIEDLGEAFAIMQDREEKINSLLESFENE